MLRQVLVRLVLLALVAPGAAGCLVLSLNPAYDDESLAWDGRLVGNWEDADDRASLAIERGEWRSYKVHYVHPIETGDLTADSGSVRLFGRELVGMRTRSRVHLGLARTYQILTLFPRERLVHNVVLALLGLDKRRWNPWSALTANRDLYDAAREALHRVGLADDAERVVIETSYGERRRLELAMALAQKPKVLLLDEPLAGLSQAERQTVRVADRAGDEF